MSEIHWTLKEEVQELEKVKETLKLVCRHLPFWKGAEDVNRKVIFLWGQDGHRAEQGAFPVPAGGAAGKRNGKLFQAREACWCEPLVRGLIQVFLSEKKTIMSPCSLPGQLEWYEGLSNCCSSSLFSSLACPTDPRSISGGWRCLAKCS